MWALAITIYCGAKLCVWLGRRQSVAPLWKQVAFLLAWPGMDVDEFLNGRRPPLPTMGEWTIAIAKTASAIFLLFVVCPRTMAFGAIVSAWAGMIGVVLTLHFGLFHLLSCGWRAVGVHATPIMNWPIAAQNLSDFWGKRWNLAFRDLANRIVFRPLTRLFIPPVALLVSFVASGLIHDVVISLPAGGGYGLPTTYFTIQGVATLLQRGQFRSQWRSGLRGWTVTFTLLALPSPLLFHPWFLQRVVGPFLHAMGALQ